MRCLILLILASALTLGLLACNSNETLLSQKPANRAPVSQTPASQPADDARRITAGELHKLWEKNDVVIIDTRPEPAYKAEHIKGSISMPTGHLLERLSELPRNKMIAAYCT
jgi:3-mercaptopyruvate sulfurtransferase SseA